MVGRLHSRQGLQSGRGAVGEGPSLLLDIFFLPPGEWMCKPLAHITVIITSLWYSSAHSQKRQSVGLQHPDFGLEFVFSS